MNTQRYVLGSLVVFLFYSIAEWLFHSICLKGWYEEGEVVMRAGGAFGGDFVWLVLGSLIMTFGFCYIFTYGYQNRGIGEGLRYGLIMGTTFGLATGLIRYAIFPIPAKLAVAGIIGHRIEMVIAGMIFAALYSPSEPGSSPQSQASDQV